MSNIKEMRFYIDKVKNLQTINEETEWNPHKAITYIVHLEVLFEGFETTYLKFKILFPKYDTINDEEIKKRIDERLKVFNNISTYNIIKAEEVDESDKITPMF